MISPSSSNGRTAAFGAANGGSSPSLGTNVLNTKFPDATARCWLKLWLEHRIREYEALVSLNEYFDRTL